MSFGPFRHRVFLAGCGATIFVLFALLSFRTPEIRKNLADESVPPSRAPASHALGANPPLTSNDPCVNLHKAVCSKTGTTRDPTGIVRRDIDGELIVLRMYEEIIRENPSWTSEQIDEELVKRVYTDKNRARVESTFRWVRAAMEKFIETQPEQVFTAREKKQLKTRLRKVTLQLPPPASVYGDEPDLLTKNDAFYERLSDGTMRLRIGGAYFFTSRSWFNMVFTLGHELAHSIDPCELKGNQIAIPAYDRLSACFVRVGLVRARKNRHECEAKDQLSEAFADWMAAQVSAKALKTYATEFQTSQIMGAVTNSVRDLCEQGVDGIEDDTEFHPSPETRIGRIFGSNPEIREVLGCPTQAMPIPLAPQDNCTQDWNGSNSSEKTL